MTDEPPAQALSTQATDADRRLKPALDALTRAATRQSGLQKQLATVTDKVMRLSRGPGTTAELNRLLAQQTALNLSLSQARQSFESARKALDRGLTQFTALQDHRIAQARDLQSGAARHHRHSAAMQRALHGLMARLSDLTAPDTSAPGDTVPTGSHPYIAHAIPALFDLLIDLDRLLCLDPHYADARDRYRPVSFVDVGCGTGRNVMLVRAAHLVSCASVTGFDINASQIAEGQRLFGLGPDLWVADAMAVDYARFDVVFSYRPFAEPALQQVYEAHLAASMAPGAYLVAPLSWDLALYPELEPMGPGPDIWRKTTDTQP